MEKEKKPDFVVTDRRKFSVDGEPRPDSVAEPATPAPEQSKTAPSEPVVAKPDSKPTPEKDPSEAFAQTPPPPETGYNAENERGVFGGEKMEFVHLLDLLAQTAMLYAGAMEGGKERRVDIVGLRQMIDLVSILDEKTKGNLTDNEKSVLSNMLFQLRMTYMEIVNLIAKQKTPGTPGAPQK